jgi:hypothetical protein
MGEREGRGVDEVKRANQKSWLRESGREKELIYVVYRVYN